MDDKFWAEFEAALGQQQSGKVLPPEGEGWFSLTEFATRFKISPETARLRLLRMIGRGKIERARAPGTNPNRPSFYRMVKNG